MPATSNLKSIVMCLVVAGCMVMLANTGTTVEPPKKEQTFSTTYAVSDLAVWRKSEEGEAQFDASVLVSLVHTIDPASWKDGGVGCKPFADNKSLVVSQTEANHDQIQKLLDRLRQAQRREQAEKQAVNVETGDE